MKNYRFITAYIKKFRLLFWTGIFFLFVTNLLDVAPPLIIMRGIDEITRRATAQELLHTALSFAALTIALAVVRFHWRMQFGKFHQNVSRDLRERIFKKLTELGPTFYSRNPIGELMSLMTNDVEAIRMGMGPGLIVLTDALFYFCTIPPIMFSLSVPLTVRTLALLPVLPFFISWLGGIIHRRYMEVQENFSELSGITQENITGIRIVKSYVQEKNQIIAFNKLSEKWMNSSLKVAWAESFMHPVMEFCVTIGVVILLFVGAREVVGGALTIGAFVAFQRYINKMAWPMTAIGWGFSLLSQARASMDRVEEFLDTPLDVNAVFTEQRPHSTGANSEQETALNLQGKIEIRNLNFRYPYSQKYILNDISLTISPGDTLGIVGPVGSGKTTLVQLLCHLFEVERGKIFVNAIDVRDIPLDVLRKHISLVPQDAFLFSSKISENMAFGVEMDPGLEALTRVAQIAKIDEEIDSLPHKYETYLGERGVNLSGGQKQRMTITRALLRKSPVIIFDDSLSAIDAHTESLILRRLNEETKKHTTIIISHRLSSLSFCNRIVVLKEGRIEAVGSPQELRTKSGTYQELLQLQGYV